MTKHEAFLLSAYTGVLLIKSNEYPEFLDYVNEKLGRTISPFELSERTTTNELRFVLRPELEELVKEDWTPESIFSNGMEAAG